MAPRLITLHVLRHGQASHNIVEWPSAPSAEFCATHHDAPLTETGIEQARAAHYPSALAEDKQAVFWVSPLRRALQTAIYAVPQDSSKTFEVYECVRERGGEKSCDLRRKKSEIERWLKDYKLASKWIVEADMSETDPLQPPVRRESMGDMLPRVFQTILKIDRLSESQGTKNLAIISHSGFLSILMSVLDVCEYKTRWLKNGEWRSVQIMFPNILSVAEYKTRNSKWLSLAMQPTLGPKNTTVGNALVQLTDTHTNRVPEHVTYATSDMLASLTFSVVPKKRAVVVLRYPLAVERHGDAEWIDNVIKHWPVVKNTKPGYCDEEMWKAMESTITPPYILNGAHFISKPAVDARVDFHEEGLHVCTHVVLICAPTTAEEVPPDRPEQSLNLPLWVSREYLAGVNTVCVQLLDEIGALSVTSVFLHDS
eukprot:Gregarina_sp_Pseudo_9__5689@NODE_810_length_2182_cov_163_112459_g761_i0_p1_GENE_NODE_810_length_2182_cov_163_112459_g761_i0NODE_810_length_2182_cov_163_112459_g761_i0_p1_ORF_typecomplete_len426_score38_68His_Phos_1/PF00300_22/1_5e22His_Phos_1/PF00300_22/8_5e03_NODE_810_length_2182_cov_163_112459_g761_i08762153